MKKNKVIVGNKYGKLTVMELEKGGKARCKCECGEEKSVYRYNLVNGNTNTKSCGCLKRAVKNIIGKKYGKLTVIRRDSVYKGTHYYICDCDCGTKGIIVSRNNLANNNTKSCGCLRYKINRGGK